MKAKSLVALFILGISSFVMADSSYTTMATILVDFNHYASPAQQESLKAITESSASAEEKELAQIILRIAHHPSADDKAELEKILANDGSSEEAKIIAKAILNMNHHPQSEDIQALKGIM